MPKTALITGITGQDGSFLAELLLAKGYRVVGLVRRNSQTEKTRLEHLNREHHLTRADFLLEYGDMADGSSLRKVLHRFKPDEVYNLAAQAHVRISFDQPEYTADVTAMGVLRLLEAVKDLREETGKAVRFFQASSSEIFGSAPAPQDEATRFHPRSPYGIAKLTAHWHTVHYREAYGLFCANGILFNHESERRAENFVSRKITRAATRIKVGLQQELYLGHLDARRDWGYAPEYVEAMWRILQAEEPDDYVLATGESHSVREFAAMAFRLLDLEWEAYVKKDHYYYRPAEVEHTCGNATKARQQLAWQPEVRFEQLVRTMIDHDLELARREAHAANYRRG